MAIIDDVVEAYQKEHTIKRAAMLAHISEQKARKLLITAGVIQPEMSREILLYRSRGLKLDEIAHKLGISRKAVLSYLPYTRPVYNQPTRSKNAEKIARWRSTRTTLPNTDSED